MGAEINEVAVFAAVTAVGLVCAAIVDATPFWSLLYGCRHLWRCFGAFIVWALVLLTVRAADFFDVDFETVDSTESDTAGSSW